MKFDKWNIVHSHKLPEVCIKSEWNNEGKGGGRERGRVRERASERGKEGLCELSCKTDFELQPAQ